MKNITTLTIILALTLGSCSQRNSTTSKVKEETTIAKIDGVYFNNFCRVEIQEIGDKGITGICERSTSDPLTRAEAKGADISTILDLVLKTEQIFINNEALNKKLFNFELTADYKYLSNDSLIIDILLPLLGVDYKSSSIYIDSISVSVINAEKLEKYATKVDQNDIVARGKKTCTEVKKDFSVSINKKYKSQGNLNLKMENYTVSEIMEKICTHYKLSYTTQDTSSIKIDYEIDLQDWEDAKIQLSEDLGLQIDAVKIKKYALVID